MPEDITKRISVTFGVGLPHGTHGSFTHDGEHWVAFPIKKYGRLTGVVDRMIGQYGLLQRHMVDWLNAHPNDGERMLMLLEQITRIDKLRREWADEKTEARTE
jgi:hypothetical protein